jgi:integrase
MTFKANITKRIRRRKLKSGETVKQLRYVLNYADPHSGQRRQEFYETLRAAEGRRADLTTKVMSDAYVDERKVPTVDMAIDHWLSDRDGKVKANTLAGYKVVVEHIRGPYFDGPAKDKLAWKASGKLPKGCRLVPMLGPIKTSELTTARIRTWHRELTALSGQYTANRAKSHLISILALNEEDYRVRAPSMPRGLGRNRVKLKKVILSPAEIGKLVEAARNDPEHGIYYAFAFLAGTRPSEQLGLLWEDVDFEANVIRIHRIQERDGSLTNMTKTEAGTREIPMGAVLRGMLLDWRVRCPRLGKELHRVFPGPGRLQPWPKVSRIGGGGPLLYQNFRHRYWAPVFKRLGLPYVTPHSARHSFISTLQAEGIEVGLVAKLAGHANAIVTLGHYTQAVRGGEAAVAALDRAYAAVR